jgi:hypothetical protein
VVYLQDRKASTGDDIIGPTARVASVPVAIRVFDAVFSHHHDDRNDGITTSMVDACVNIDKTCACGECILRMTPLAIAARNDRLDMATLLIERYHANVHAQNDMALLQAIPRKNKDMISLLFDTCETLHKKSNAKCNGKSMCQSWDNTPARATFMYKIINRNVICNHDVFEHVLQQSANVFDISRDDDFLLVEDIKKKPKNFKKAMLLLKYGASRQKALECAQTNEHFEQELTEFNRQTEYDSVCECIRVLQSLVDERFVHFVKLEDAFALVVLQKIILNTLFLDRECDSIE